MSLSEKKTAETILSEPKRFSIPTRGILRVVGIKRLRFSIKGLYLGTLILISKEISTLKGQDGKSIPDVFASMESSSEIMARVIAYSVLNGRWRVKILGGWLTRFFLWRVDGKNLQVLVSVILDQMNIVDFFTSIVSIGGLNVLGKKQETSPIDEGSQIAPGTSSEQ